MTEMRPPAILLAAIALFSLIGGARVQSCVVGVPDRLYISNENVFLFPLDWGDKDCNIQLVAKDGTVYGSADCKQYEYCYVPMEIGPQCDGGMISPSAFFFKTNCAHCKQEQSKDFFVNNLEPYCLNRDRVYKGCGSSKDICAIDQTSSGPGCYCKNGLYLYQKNNTCVDPSKLPGCRPIPAPTPLVGLYAEPCIEVDRELVVTWNPQTFPINKYEVRDSTGDFIVGGAVGSDASSVTIDAPPVGIYEVTVFGVDNTGQQPRNFTESARFITKEENIIQKEFGVFALPDAKGVTVCFSSAQKDVSYMCQEDNGDKKPCKDCASYSRDDGTGTITIYMQGGGEVLKQSFKYRV